MRPSQAFWGTGAKAIYFKFRGTREQKSKTEGNLGEQKQFGRTGNIENQDFDFGKQGKMPTFFRGTREQVSLGGPQEFTMQ